MILIINDLILCTLEDLIKVHSERRTDLISRTKISTTEKFRFNT